MGRIEIQTKLKGLESQLQKLKAERDLVVREINTKQQDARNLKKKIHNINNELYELKQKMDNELIISEHAILRYIERVIGIDLEDIKNKIIPSDKKEIIKGLGNCTYKMDTHSIKVKDGVVVTVMEN